MDRWPVEGSSMRWYHHVIALALIAVSVSGSSANLVTPRGQGALVGMVVFSYLLVWIGVKIWPSSPEDAPPDEPMTADDVSSSGKKAPTSR